MAIRAKFRCTEKKGKRVILVPADGPGFFAGNKGEVRLHAAKDENLNAFAEGAEYWFDITPVKKVTP